MARRQRSLPVERVMGSPIIIMTLSLFLFTLVTVAVVEKIAPQPLIFALAESMVDIIDPADENIDATDIIADQDGPKDDDIVVKSGGEYPSEDPRPLPASLIKATRVGAKIREVQNPHDHDEEGGSLDDDDATLESEITSPNSNAEEMPPNPKPPSDGCHWGGMGCNKAKRHPGAAAGEVNSSSVDSVEADDDGIGQQGDGAAATKSPPSSSSLAGSATAKIEAMKRRGRPAATSPPVWNRDTAEMNNNESYGTGSNEPPHGFKLAGRIVTSPSDGLSYFLDAPQVVGAEDRGGDWMMTIPYAYLDCGPTIESTTEAFSLSDMVLRHFPASASMGHWTNLAGGITIDSDMTEGEEGGKGTKYIDGNSHEGHPKLLVALSPLEITVSGNNEESRIFNPGEVVLMEDALGKGHQMRAARVNQDNADSSRKFDGHGHDMSVLMVTLPHTIHLPMYDWLEEASYLHDSESVEEPLSSTGKGSSSSGSPPTSYGAEDALYGLAPRHLHQKHRRLRKFSTSAKKPCPLEYDSAYSSLFMPTYNQYRRNRHRRKTYPRWRGSQIFNDPTFDESYPPPPGFSFYDKHSEVFEHLPSLRRTMLFGMGISLSSSFIYCVQLLYPPLLALLGGGTVVLGGMMLNVLAARWGYRRFVADWEEEWRWKREVGRNKMHHAEMMDKGEEINVDDIVLHSASDAATENEEANDDRSSDESEIETELAE
eukprot:CAMPEP_0181104868 /NCGR_PEP_ID=MMETSP1071-20121207/15663_1 /TAXON_ID=35127 /ORGANISM="Thalassiosira sp., Strain NH16" /LENGTH=711 /DNA_ID=CAMNT_0023188107 /DNA_START=84 /DNA_END=2219 /DNA_ORIENTATION=+